jgi:hypothetical protein
MNLTTPTNYNVKFEVKKNVRDTTALISKTTTAGTIIKADQSVYPGRIHISIEDDDSNQNIGDYYFEILLYTDAGERIPLPLDEIAVFRIISGVIK